MMDLLLDLHYLQNYFSFLGTLPLLHSERPKLYTILAFLSAVGSNVNVDSNFTNIGIIY